jgi:spore coat polysaccharide biosynthesis predicted glycosyltransferase SpsG
MRCRTIAFELLKRDWVVYFIGYGLPDNHHKGLPSGSKINFINLETEVLGSKDMSCFLAMVGNKFSFNADLVVVDSYYFSRNDFAELVRFLQDIPIMVIDDLATRDTPANIVVNPNPLFDPHPYKRQSIPNILCGADYTIIRPEIRALRERRYDPDGYLMVTLGGGDVSAPLLKILQAIPEDFPRRVCVSVSPNCNLTEIDKWIARRPDMRFINCDSDSFPDLLAASSIAITGGGTTLWETYCLGIPCLTVVWVDNQSHTTSIIKEQATGFLLDIISHINVEFQSETLESGIKSLSDSLSSSGSFRSSHEEGSRITEIVTKHHTSLLSDRIESIDQHFISSSIAKLSENSDFVKEMIERQRTMIDGAGVERIVDAFERMNHDDVPLFF